MRILLRRFLVGDRKTLVRVVTAATAAGSALLYSNLDPTNSRPTLTISIPRNVDASLGFLSAAADFPPTLSISALTDHDPHFFRVAPHAATETNNGSQDEGSGRASRCLGRDTIADAAAKVGPAVVNISVPHVYFGIGMGMKVGSGTIINADGTILTCAHIVNFQGTHASSDRKVEVTLQDGRTFEGTVLHVDLHSDIALLKITSKLSLPTAKLGSSKKIRPGDWVIAMGCPLSLQNTVTAGIVSCVDRKSSDLGLSGMRREYLQTDCAINVGNSGGPLVNIDGEVIGVNIFKVAAADGLGFAVPVDSVSKIIHHFKKSGRVVRPWLGLKMVDLNEMIIAQLKERDPAFPNVNKGVLVPMVTPGSPADRAGFRPGDVVIEFEGKPVASITEIIEIMDDKVGIPLKVVVKRAKDGVAKLTVTPEEANPDM